MPSPHFAYMDRSVSTITRTGESMFGSGFMVFSQLFVEVVSLWDIAMKFIVGF